MAFDGIVISALAEELREKLLLLDKSLSELYTHGYFLNGSLLSIKLGEEGELSLESFQHLLEKVNLYDDIKNPTCIPTGG